MATKIVTKNSSTASAVPTTSDLVQGELAVNVADKRLFTEDNTGTIVELGTNPSTIDIDAGTIDGAVIGDNTPAAITGSTVTSTGNIVVSGTVDGRDVAADGTKLDGIEASADVTDTTNVTAAGALMDSEVTNLAQVKAFDSSDYATAAQGTTADNALPKSGGAMTGAITTNSTFDGRDVATDGTKLDGIESGATADQTAAEIKTAYESNANTNAFTDADHTKLDGIEASADVTDTANVTAAGALMDSELASEASVKALNQGVATTDSPSFVNLTLSGTGSVKVPSGTTAQRDGSPANGMFRYNSTNEQFEGYQSGAWGAIGGGGGSNTFTADTFTGDGSTTAYALSQVVNSEDNLLVFIAGVFQQQSAYSIATASGTTTLTFATAPANTREIIVYSVASAVSGSNLNIDSMTGDGSDTTLSLTIAPVNENNTQVFIDGVYQNKDTYSISGTTLTFSTAPPNGSAVEVMTMTQTEINVPVDGTITPAKIASGDFYFDTNTLYVDSTNNRVGVGTTSPNANLDIESSNATLHLTDSDDNTYAEVRNNGGTLTIGSDVGASAGGSSINFKVDNTERMRIDSSGNVGIGTSSPARTFHAKGASGISTTGKFEAGGSQVYIQLSSTGQADGDSGYIGYDSSKNLTLFTDNTERMRIDSSGNVGIGTSSPSGSLVVSSSGAEGVEFFPNSFTNGNTIQHYDRSSSVYSSVKHIAADHRFNIGSTERMRIDSSGRVLLNKTAATSSLTLESQAPSGFSVGSGFYSSATGSTIEFKDSNTTANYKVRIGAYTDDMVMFAGGSERMRINDSGNVLVGTTATTPTTGGIALYKDSTRGIVRAGTSITSADAVAAWYNPNGKVGQIVTSGSSTSYSTSSDYRLKENVVELTGATERLKQLNPSRFNFIADADTTVDGFLAHEVADVVPEAISGEKDAVDADGNPEYQGIDQSKLVPLLVATIQELEARITELENN